MRSYWELRGAVTRRLRLRDARRVLQRYASRILDDVSEAEKAVGGLTGRLEGSLRVSAGWIFAVGLLALMLPIFLAAYPDVRLFLTIDKWRSGLLADDINIAIRIGPPSNSELIARSSERSSFGCVPAHHTSPHAACLLASMSSRPTTYSLISTGPTGGS